MKSNLMNFERTCCYCGRGIRADAPLSNPVTALLAGLGSEPEAIAFLLPECQTSPRAPRRAI